MQIRNFLLLACLLAASFQRANSSPINESHDHTATGMEESCNLPAPTNFRVLSAGQNWIHLAWDLTNPYHAHRINLYSCANPGLNAEDVFLYSIVADAGVTDTIIYFIPPKGPYLKKYEIKTICTSGDSPNSSWINCIIPPVGYILELVVNAFPPVGNTANCTIGSGSSGQKCYFPSSGIATFRVRQTSNLSNYKIFGIEKLPGQTAPHRFLERVLTPNNLSTPYVFNFFVDFNSPPSSGEQYQIMYGSQVVARFIANYDPTTGSYLESVFIMDGYEIVRTSPYEGPGGKPEGAASELINDRDGASLVLTQPATASPNPFTDALDIFPGQPTTESIHLQMYNLSGQKVLDQQLPGGQEQYSLSTTNLPSGIYLLRIEADGEVQTLKVVKSE